MKLNELGDHVSQLKKINQYLLENFGYTINMGSVDSEKVNSTLKKVLARQAQIANETNVKDYHKIPEYNKTVMVAEALKILLREIAPKRQAKEKNTNVQESKMTKQVKEDAWIKGREKKRQRASGSVRDLPGARPPAQSGPKKEKKVKPANIAHPVKPNTIVKTGPQSDTRGSKGPTLTAEHKTNTKHKHPHPEMGEGIRRVTIDKGPAGSPRNAERGEESAHQRTKKQKGQTAAMKGWKESINPRSVTLENLRTLLEQDLDQAELVLAAKDMVDRVQKMAEDLAEMQVEELMPLVDAMKEHFGPDIAQVFNSSVEATLQQALDTIKATRDGVDNAVLALTGEAPVQSDMGAMPAPEMGMDAEMEVPSEEDFGGDEAMAGDVPAIGREMKPESISTSALAQAKKILMQGAKNGKVSRQSVKEAALALTKKKR